VTGLRVEPAFVDRAIRDTGTEDALPLLAFALRQLHDPYRADRVISLSDYKALGDPAAGLSPLENAVKQAADGVLQAQRPGEASLKALREAFVPAMVRVSEQGSYARRAALWDALPQAARPLLDALVAARLLVRRQGEGQRSTAEVAHEALLRVWPLLRGWLDESREFLLGSQQLEQDLVQWQDASQADKSHALLSGLKLAKARAWLAEHGEQLRPEMRAFIRGSDVHEKSRMAQLKLQKDAVSSLRQFESGRELEGLLAAISNGEELKSLDRDSEYSTYSPVFALQQMLYRVDDDNQFRESNRLEQAGLVYCIGFSPDSQLIVTGGERGIGRLWSSSGKLICELRGHKDNIRSVGISPCDPLFATASDDGTVILWDYTGKRKKELACHEKAIISVCFSPHEPLFATASDDGSVKLWDYSGKAINSLRCHQEPICSMSFSPHEPLFATASEDGTAKLWNYSGEEICELTGHNAEVNSVCFSRAARLVITASRDGLARVWKETGELLQELPGHRGGVLGAVFSPDGELVATASEDGLIRLWSNSWQILQEFRGHVDPPYCITFSPNGDVLAACREIRAILFKRSRISIQKLPNPRQGVTQINYSRDGSRVITALNDGTIEILNSTREPIKKLAGHGWVTSICCSTEAKRIAIVSQNGAVRLRSYSGNLVEEFFADGSPVWGADISPNGEIIATASNDGKIRLWDQTGSCMDELLLPGDSSPLSSVRFSPNGKEVAAISWYGRVQYWELPRSLLRTFDASAHGRRCLDIRFSPDGKLIATASEDGTARLWSCTPSDNEPLQELRGHQGWVNRVEFSPSGGLIATAASDGVIRLWSYSGELVHEFHTFQIRPNSICFSSDGKEIAIASHHMSASRWNIYGLDDLLDMGNKWLQDYLNRE
jgi:WD40 repeat protein